MKNSAIAWTDHTFNPWWGCARVSPGCENCYAETFAARIGHGKRLPTIWGVGAERRPMSHDYWREPLNWNRDAERDGVRRRVFCASMADVFELLPERNVEGRAVQNAARSRLWTLIETTPYLDWLLLTKRPQNVAALAPWGDSWPFNVWLGTTVEDERRAAARIPHLLRVPARVRFLSCEPLLEAVELGLLGTVPKGISPRHSGVYEHIDWVIVGGESGPGARMFNPSWAKDIVNQCRAAGVACFVKQLGSNVIDFTGAIKDRKGGDPDEWPAELRVRQWPEVSP